MPKKSRKNSSDAFGPDDFPTNKRKHKKDLSSLAPATRQTRSKSKRVCYTEPDDVKIEHDSQLISRPEKPVHKDTLEQRIADYGAPPVLEDLSFFKSTRNDVRERIPDHKPTDAQYLKLHTCCYKKMWLECSEAMSQFPEWTWTKLPFSINAILGMKAVTEHHTSLENNTDSNR